MPAFYAALANGYRVGQNAYLNSPAVNNSLVPETHDTATSDVAFISANATRKIFALPGGDASLAVGLDARLVHQNNPGEPYALQGDILMDGSFYAKGSQTVTAAFAELVAPVLEFARDRCRRPRRSLQHLRRHRRHAQGRHQMDRDSRGRTARHLCARLPGTRHRGKRQRRVRLERRAGPGRSGALSGDRSRRGLRPGRQRGGGADDQQSESQARDIAKLHVRRHPRALETQRGHRRLFLHPPRPRDLPSALLGRQCDSHTRAARLRPARAHHRIPDPVREFIVLGHRRNRLRLEDAVGPRQLRPHHDQPGCLASDPVAADLRRHHLSLRRHGGTDRAQRLDRNAGEPRHVHGRLDQGPLVPRRLVQLPQRHARRRRIARLSRSSACS